MEKATTLYFAPVCGNCLSVIMDDVFYEEEEFTHESGYRGIARNIYPGQCPKCGKYFENIEMPTRLPYDNPLRPLEVKKG